MRDNVFLSIVIANYNYGCFLETAIQSVTSQCGGPIQCDDGVFRLPVEDAALIELIICDAQSTDNSMDVVKKHERELAWWCSEPDGGQSAAFNKGFSHATGRFLTWLNADDVLVSGALKLLLRAIRNNPQQEWFAGGSVHFNSDMNVILCTRTRRFSEYEARHGQVSVYSPSSFFSRRLYDEVGEIDESFRFSMDTHLWCKFYLLSHIRFMVLPGYVFGFRYHAKSKTTCVHFKCEESLETVQKNVEQGNRERKIIRDMFPPFSSMSTVVRWLLMDWHAKFLSVFDTLRYRGKKLVACGFIREE